MTTERANPFSSVALDDFEPKKLGSKRPIVDGAELDQLAESAQFSSRILPKPNVPASPPAASSPVPQATAEPNAPRKQRRYTTGRNKQLNIKVTEATFDKFYLLADAQNAPLGEILARALDAYDEKLKRAS